MQNSRESLEPGSKSLDTKFRGECSTHFFAWSTTPGTWSDPPTTSAETLPPSCSAAVRAESEPESMTPWRCSRKTRAWGGVAVAYVRRNGRQHWVYLLRSILRSKRTSKDPTALVPKEAGTSAAVCPPRAITLSLSPTLLNFVNPDSRFFSNTHSHTPRHLKAIFTSHDHCQTTHSDTPQPERRRRHRWSPKRPRGGQVCSKGEK